MINFIKGLTGADGHQQRTDYLLSYKAMGKQRWWIKFIDQEWGEVTNSNHIKSHIGIAESSKQTQDSSGERQLHYLIRIPCRSLVLTI